MRLLRYFKCRFSFRLTALVVILSLTWTIIIAGPAPAAPKTANDKAQAISSPEKDKPKEEDLRPVAIAGKSSEEAVSKKKFPWLIVIGAVAVVGGVVAILLLTKKKETTGKISVTSTPSAAKLYLDGGDTTKSTPCTLDNVTPGSHVVRVALDGYKDFSQTVSVAAGQTANVTAALTKHAITVYEPTSGSSKTRTVEFEIRWVTDSNLAAGARSARTATGLRVFGGSAEVPESGASYTINAVDIDLYKGGAKVLTIAAGSDNDGLERWTAPADQTLGTDYRVRVTCSSEATIYGESGLFAIATHYGSIEVTSTPTGAKVWLDGTDTGQKTPIILGGIPRGTHRLKVETSYFGKWEGDVVVVESQTTNVAANLTPYSYEFVTSWGTEGTGDGQFQDPVGLATDSGNNVYVTDDQQNRVQKFTSGGTFLGWWGLDNLGSTGWHNPGSGRTSVAGSGDGQLNRPFGVGIDTSNNVYIIEYVNHRVQKFTSGGSFIKKWGAFGTGNGQFQYPAYIALDASNNVYVTELVGERVQKFNSEGTYLIQWGSSGTGEGQFDHPFGIAVDSSGRVYVADRDNGRVQKFTSTGTFMKMWAVYLTSKGIPRGIAWDPSGVLLIAEGTHNCILKMSLDGEPITNWGSNGSGPGNFSAPYGVAVDSSGNVYAADTNNHRIQKFRYIVNALPAVVITYTPMK
jgi:hypothetical protein